jgi:uncharacterized C2H2 Zn-finger protein
VTHMTVNRDKSGEPIMCSKCNIVFESDTDYIQHYNEKHRPTEEAWKEDISLPFLQVQ